MLAVMSYGGMTVGLKHCHLRSLTIIQRCRECHGRTAVRRAAQTDSIVILLEVIIHLQAVRV